MKPNKFKVGDIITNESVYVRGYGWKVLEVSTDTYLVRDIQNGELGHLDRGAGEYWHLRQVPIDQRLRTFLKKRGEL